MKQKGTVFRSWLDIWQMGTRQAA